jgi:Queuosine salvage protein
LNVITYDASLVDALTAQEYIESGSEREIGIRASSVLAVEALRVEIIRIQQDTESRGDGVSSVLLDFFLWDLAKKIELGEEQLEISGLQELPAHRTRSIWY